MKKTELLRRKRISIARKGMKFSKEHKENISKAKSGIKLSKQSRKNISKGMIGHKVSKQTKKNLSKAITKYHELIDKEDWKKSKKLFNNLKNDGMFVGLMLSDASIPKPSKDHKNAHFTITQKEDNKGLIEDVSEYLTDLGITHTITKYFRERYNSWEIILYTKHHIIFTELRKIWYKNGKKIVPKDIRFDKFTLAYWFMGDGSSWRVGKERNRVIVQLATQGFNLPSVKRLKKKLELLNIPNVKIYKKDNGYNIQISTIKGVTKFNNTVEENILLNFLYKIKYPKLVTKIR